jgi:glycosyltransferase involved in cell wall biosynthesis/ubiquinone/menaquinone biosynthesis C-methylase UbiE
MKKILHIIQSLTGGGAARETIYLARQSTDVSNFKHEVLTLRPSIEEGLRLAKKYDVPVIENPGKNRLIKKIQESDIVQVGWWNNAEITEFLRSNIPSSRLIIRYHVSGHTSPHIILKEHLKMADINIISYNALPVLREFSEDWRKKRVFWILHGTDFNRIKFNPINNKTRTRFTVGYIGSVSFVKMHPKFVSMSNSIDVPNIKFIICGHVAEDAIKTELETASAIQKFEFTGYRENIASIIKTFDVFGYPLCEETYASTDLVLQEVMYAGIPPVIFPHGGLTQTVRNGYNGIVVENTKEYKEAIEYLYQNPNERKRLGNNAAIFVKSNLGIENTVKQYNKIYNELIFQPKTWHEWGKDPHESLINQSLTISDITGEGNKVRTSDLFIESLGGHGEKFQKSKNNDLSDRELFLNDAKIAKLSDVELKTALIFYQEFDPNDCHINFWLGIIFLFRKEFERATKHLMNSLQYRFKHWRIYFYLAHAFLKINKVQGAHKVFKYLELTNPEHEAEVKYCFLNDYFEKSNGIILLNLEKNSSKNNKNQFLNEYNNNCIHSENQTLHNEELNGIISNNISVRNISSFTYSRESHFPYFKNNDLALYNKRIDKNDCDLKVYQDLLVYTFILENIPKDSKILEVGGGDSRVLKAIMNDYECWNIDKLEGLGNGLTSVNATGYRLVEAYMGEFTEELPGHYFDFIFSISALEHVGDDKKTFQNICLDIDRVLKPGGYSLHCFDVVLKKDEVWTNQLLPHMFENFETINSFIPLDQLKYDDDLFVMSKQAYIRRWQHITKKPYEEFGEPVSYNILWKKKEIEEFRLELTNQRYMQSNITSQSVLSD